jgi:hypothetical protein
MAIRSLALLNEKRGSQSFGVFDSQHRWLKIADPANVAIRRDDFTAFIDEACKTRWVTLHTRASTRGNVCTNNAHPFQYGPVLGCHNGSVDAPNKYAVDSMYAFDLLSNEKEGAAQKALGVLAGWYVLVWGDQRNGNLYFISWNNTSLSFAFADRKTAYFSSDADHLHAAVGIKPHAKLESGELWCYSNDGKFRKVTDKFKGGERKFVTTNYYDDSDYYFRRQTWGLCGKVCKFTKNGPWMAKLYTPHNTWRYVACQEAINLRLPEGKPMFEYDVTSKWLDAAVEEEAKRSVQFLKEQAAKEGTDAATEDTAVATPAEEKEAQEQSKVIVNVVNVEEIAKQSSSPLPLHLEDALDAMIQAGELSPADLRRLREIRGRVLKELYPNLDDGALDNKLWREGWFGDETPKLTFANPPIIV